MIGWTACRLLVCLVPRFDPHRRAAGIESGGYAPCVSGVNSKLLQRRLYSSSIVLKTLMVFWKIGPTRKEAVAIDCLDEDDLLALLSPIIGRRLRGQSPHGSPI